MKYALFLAATENYLPYATALLNSIEKLRVWESFENAELHVYLLLHEVAPDSPFRIRVRSAYSFTLRTIDVQRSDVRHPVGMPRNEFIKRARYSKLAEIGMDYDAVCLMDADMFLVASEFAGLFDLVRGTRRLIGCNERFKWRVGPSSYFVDGEPVCRQQAVLRAMICNVPALFDPREWTDVLREYQRIAFWGYQDRQGRRVGIGDLFAFNLAVHACGREEDVTMFPMSVMTQVHHTWANPWTHLINDSGRWRTWAGDRVYSIHGRVAQAGFVPGNLALYRKEWSGWEHLETFAPRIEAGLRAVQRAWYELAVKGRVSIYDFVPRNPEWDRLAT